MSRPTGRDAVFFCIDDADLYQAPADSWVRSIDRALEDSAGKQAEAVNEEDGRWRWS
jgi:hypothetical protein